MTYYAFHNNDTGANKVVRGFGFHDAVKRAPYAKGWRFLRSGEDKAWVEAAFDQD